MSCVSHLRCHLVLDCQHRVSVHLRSSFTYKQGKFYRPSLSVTYRSNRIDWSPLSSTTTRATLGENFFVARSRFIFIGRMDGERRGHGRLLQSLIRFGIEYCFGWTARPIPLGDGINFFPFPFGCSSPCRSTLMIRTDRSLPPALHAVDVPSRSSSRRFNIFPLL